MVCPQLDHHTSRIDSGYLQSREAFHGSSSNQIQIGGNDINNNHSNNNQRMTPTWGLDNTNLHLQLGKSEY